MTGQNVYDEFHKIQVKRKRIKKLILPIARKQFLSNALINPGCE